MEEVTAQLPHPASGQQSRSTARRSHASRSHTGAGSSAPAVPGRWRGWGAMSLRHWLTLPYVALVLGVALTVGTLSYVTGRQAVDTLSEKLLLETADRIGQAVDRHVVGSMAALEAAFPDGLAAPAALETDIAALRRRFWIATSLHLDPNNYVYYGNRAGQFFGLWRHSRSEAELRLKLKADEPRSISGFIGLDGALADPVTESSMYDPRLRPWYKAGQTHSTHTWTSIYIDYRTTELVATRARRVLDARGDFAGVVATDMSLRGLNDFLQRLRLSPHGVALIIERDGNLIASSHSANVARDAAGGNRRINITTGGDAMERAAFDAVKKSGVALASGSSTLDFEGPGGEPATMAFAHVKDAVGLDWIVAVAVPRSDLMGGIPRNVTRTVVIAAAAALLAVLLGLGILRWITRDLARLATAARLIGGHIGGHSGGHSGGQVAAQTALTEMALPLHRKDEIGALADCFSQMQQRLRTDQLTGLVNRDAISRRVDERIGLHRRAGDQKTFALLFIDLDDFKLVNDRWGHEAGDRVLIEIGQRLRAHTRSTDMVARYAGDEFVVLLDSVDGAAMAEQLREKIHHALSQPLFGLVAAAGAPLPVSGSVGLAVYANGDNDAQAMLRRADADMYRRKAVSKAG
jgi:diguanylate cyclase (GGDEF)-like protein